LAVLGLLAIMANPACALIVQVQTNTTSAPSGVGNDPGWNNVSVTTSSSARNVIYLGNGWALTAKHVGPEPNNPDQTLHFAAGSADIIPGQGYIVPNPNGVANPGTNELHLESDLRLFRLKSEPSGMASIFDASPQFTLATTMVTNSTPAAEREVTFIGNGLTREDNLTNWSASWQEVPPSLDPVAYTGYSAAGNVAIPADYTKRWGKNVIEDENQYFSGQGDADFRITFRQSNGSGAVLRDTVSNVTQFSEFGGLVNEAQVVHGDSGSAVFRKRGTQWELIGIVFSAYTKIPDASGNQSVANAVYGNLTAFADLTFYNNPIQDIFKYHPHYSLIGDVDMDGNFQTDVTDDMAAFVAGWGYNNSLNKATALSWSKGDIAHSVSVGTCFVPLGNGVCAGGDGKTDVYDFIAFRDELNNPAAGATLAAMLGFGGGSVVPEPTTAALAIFAASLFAITGRKRRSSR
jgi:hypothetical protein